MTKGTEMHIANDSPKTVYATAYGDKESTLKREIGFHLKVNGTGMGLNASKESSWQVANVCGFTKIMPGQSIMLEPVADTQTIYVTIKTDDNDKICLASPICKNQNVIVDPYLSLQNAKKNKIWEYEDSQKPESKCETEANFNYEKEYRILLSKFNELDTKYKNLEKQRVENNNNRNDQITTRQKTHYRESESSCITNRNSYEMAIYSEQ